MLIIKWHFFVIEMCNLQFDILLWKDERYVYNKISLSPMNFWLVYILQTQDIINLHIILLETKVCNIVIFFDFFSSFLQSNTAVEDRSLGKFLRWLINEQNGTFFGMKLPTGFQLIGQTTLQQYRAWLDYFDRQSKLENRSFVTRTTKRAYARIGVCFIIHFYPNLRYFQ